MQASSARSVITLRGMVIAVTVVGGVLLLIELWSAVLLILVGLLFTAALSPWVDTLTRRGLGRGWAVLLVAFSFAALIVFFAAILIPVLADQGRTLIDKYPDARSWVAGQLRDHGASDAATQVERFELGDLVPPRVVARAGAGVLGVVSTVASLVLLTCYFLIDAHRLSAFVYYLLPRRFHHHARALMPELQKAVGGYVRGQLLCSLCAFGFTFVVLTVLRVPNALALAVLAFLGDMVPVIGVYVIIVPTALAALQVSALAAVIVAVAQVVYTQLENNVLVPRIFGSTLNLPASAILVGILLGGHLLGFAGALLSLPATAALAVVIRYWHDQRAAHEQTEPAANAGLIVPETVADQR